MTDDAICEQCRELGFEKECERVGYKTSVGEGGLKLSGGQRMMVAIVAAKIKNCRILLLDEATAPLDPATERRLQDTLKFFEVRNGNCHDHVSFDILYSSHQSSNKSKSQRGNSQRS